MAAKMNNRNTARYNIEKQYIVLDDFNFAWNLSDVKKFRALWIAGKSKDEISLFFGRHVVEVELIEKDQLLHGKIEQRPTGICGLQVET